MTAPNPDMVARAGEHYVAAEINWRGAYAAPWSGNLPGIDIVGMDSQRKKMAYIQVKSKRPKQFWQTNFWVGLKPPNGKFDCISWGECTLTDQCDDPKCKVNFHDHSKFKKCNLEKLEEQDDNDRHYWVFVSLKTPPEAPSYWIVPEAKVRKIVREKARSLGKSLHGHRAEGGGSPHTGVHEKDLSEYLGRWGLLELGLTDDATLPSPE